MAALLGAEVKFDSWLGLNGNIARYQLKLCSYDYFPYYQFYTSYNYIINS